MSSVGEELVKPERPAPPLLGGSGGALGSALGVPDSLVVGNGGTGWWHKGYLGQMRRFCP